MRCSGPGEAPKPLRQHALLLPWQGTEEEEEDEERRYIFRSYLTLCGLDLNPRGMAQTHSSVGLAGPAQRFALLFTRDQRNNVEQICVK